MYSYPVKVTKGSHPEAVALMQAAFPGYRGRTYRISDSTPTHLDSYWDGGSRDYFVFIRMADLKTLAVEANHPFYCKDKPRTLKHGLPAGIALVEHSICCGKDCGLTIYFPKAEADPELTSASAELALTE